MSDAGLHHKPVARNFSFEESWRKGIILFQICQEVLRVVCVRESGRLDEFKREMWLLLVAAGSGYLARCWQKTLKPRPQLTDFAHVDPQPREERASSSSSSTAQLLEDSSPNAPRRSSPASTASELVSKHSKRNFSPKALSKKLFSEVGKSGKTPKKDKEVNSIADENRLITAGADRSGDPGIGHSKRSPWPSFRSKTREGPSENSEDSGSPGCLGRTGDAFRKSRDRRRPSDCGSSSSRSLQALLGDGGDGFFGSSRRELPPVGSSCRNADASSAEDRSRSGLLVVETSQEGSGRPVEVLSSEVSLQAAGSQVEPSESCGKKDAPKGVVNDNTASDVPPSVAEVVARIEKGTQSLKAETVNAVLSLRAANQAQASLMDREKVRNLQLEGLELNAREEAEVLPGGKCKRRADVGKGDREDTALSSLLTGKRSKDSNQLLARESSDITLTSVTSKRMKDVVETEDSGNVDEACLSDPFAAVDLSQVFFGFDSAFLGSPKDERSPFRNSKRHRYSNKSSRVTIRRMRESPKPVSALESCLRAQMPFREEGSRVARALNFSSLVTRGGQNSPERIGQTLFLKDSPFSPASLFSKDGFDGSGEQSGQTVGALGLPLLKTPPSKSAMLRKDGRFYRRGQQLVESNSNYPRKVVLEERGRIVSSRSKINDVLWRTTTLPVAPKKRRVSQACSPSTAPDILKVKGYELEALVIPPMEGLLFSFGVGIGVMSLISEPDSEVERLGEQLKKSQEKIEILNKLLRQAEEFASPWSGPQLKQVVDAASSFLEGGTAEQTNGQYVPTVDLLALVPSVDETRLEGFDLYRREAPETPQQIEHMAELEAELEAELDALTSGMSTGITEDTSGAPDFEELDPEGVAGVADRDLGVEGLPALLDWDDDNDDFITEESRKHGEGVPPRELARLLRKVQNSWQEQQISELEADLQETLQKLQVVERELQLLKDQMLCLTPLCADVETESPDLEAADVPESFVSSEERPQIPEITPPNQSVFDDHKCIPDKSGNDIFGKVITEAAIEDPEKVDDKLLSPTVPVTQLSQPATSLCGSVGSLMLSEESMESEAQADNDAVCDEFLNSVFGLSEGVQTGEENLTTISLVSAREMPSSPKQGLSTLEENKCLTIPYDLKDGNPPFTPTGEDLDQVVGELLKRDSSSVKNAINAFLLWEAETEDVPIKDDVIEEELVQSYSRRTAGKNPTPQKTSSSSPTPSKTSIISTRLEQLALSAFTSEKMPLVDKASGSSKRHANNSEDKSLKRVEKGVGVASLQTLSMSDDRNVIVLGLKKDQSSRTPKREAVKSEVSVRDSPREIFHSEIPVFGGVSKEFQALLDTRRELRYSSAKVQLSLTGPPLERDSTPVYRHREDASRAGTNSPIGKISGKNLYVNSRAKNSRMSNENRLYQNPTSDWLAEVGSPPDN